MFINFCYLIIFETAKTEKINPIIMYDDNPKIVEEKFNELGYKFDKPLKRNNDFSKLYNNNGTFYYKIIPCLQIKDKFFELKEITNL